MYKRSCEVTFVSESTTVVLPEKILPARLAVFVSIVPLRTNSQSSVATAPKMSDKMKVNATGRFAVHDLASTVNGTISSLTLTFNRI